MSYSGVKISRALKIVFSNFILFVPAGIVLVALKIAEINQILIVVFSGLIICIYYLYILKTDAQIKEIISEFRADEMVFTLKSFNIPVVYPKSAS